MLVESVIHVPLYAGQNSGKSDGTGSGGTKAKDIPKEVASTINDGLYYFEQVRNLLLNDMIYLPGVRFLISNGNNETGDKKESIWP